MRQHTKYYSPVYREMPVNAGPARPVQAEILDRLDATLSEALERHSRVLVVQLVLCLPVEGEWQPDNSALSHFTHAWKTHLFRLGLDPLLFWTREQQNGSHQHWHMVVCLSGNRTRSGYNHFLKARDLWCRTLGIPDAGGLVHHVGDHMVHRNVPDELNDAMYHLSYLAKCRSKLPSSGGIRQFGGSQVTAIS